MDFTNETVATTSETATSTKTAFPLLAVNTTPPPEQYRFIPGSTPTFVNKTVTTLKDRPFNQTGYYIEEEGEAGFNEIQTLFLACFATLIPLVVILVTGFVIRILWRRYKRRRDCLQYDGVIGSENHPQIADRPLHSHLLNGEKLGETHLNTDEMCDGSINNGIKGSSNNHSTTNGSIITMTLKNNHLIVETEERNDIEEDSRETTMKYSPGARDGVFVVEVQQGVRRSPNSGTQTYHPVIQSSLNDQCALIHNPPERFNEEDLEEDDEKYYAETTSRTETPDLSRCRTGLSQSNQSLANQSYTYGNQHGYDNGYYGYPNYSGYVNDEPLQKLVDRNKPKIMSAVYKSPRGIDAIPLDPLLSDVRGKRDSDFDAVQEEQTRLGNAIDD